MNTYRTHGTCSQVINFEVENNIIKSVEFVGGCSGNTQGVHEMLKVWIYIMPITAIKV